MQQQLNDTENKFLQIENDAEADLSQMNNHWAQMKNTLGVQNPQKAMPKKWLWVGLTILVAIMGLLFFANIRLKNNDNVNESNVSQTKRQIMDSTSFQKNMDTSSKNKITNIEFNKKSNNDINIFKSKVSNKDINLSSNYKSAIVKKLKKGNDAKINTGSETKMVSISKSDSITSNNNVEQIKNIDILNNFISKIQKKAEFFTIYNFRDTTIKAAEGTVFYIPMNSFNTTDSVQFEVKEFYKYSDMVANGLTTMADDKQLISGGMLSLIAKVNGKEIAMNPTKEIRVFIPNLTAKDSMEIFEGKKKTEQKNKNTGFITNNINWQLTDIGLLSPRTVMYLRAIDLRDDYVSTRTTLIGNKIIGIFPKSNKCTISNEELKVLLKKKYGTYYDIIKIKKVWKRNLLFQKRDNEIYDGIAKKDFEGIGDTIQFQPQYKRFMDLKIIDTVYEPNGLFGNQVINLNSNSAIQKALKMIDNKYSIGINKLGWINCDKFYYYRGEKLDIYVNVNDEAKNYVTYLIFENEKSIINGFWSNEEFKFLNIPLGIPAKVISIGVKDGQTVFAMKNIITSKNIVKDLKFEQVSPKDCIESLKTLDKPIN